MTNPEKKKAATVHPALKAVAGRFRCEAKSVLEIASRNTHTSDGMQHNLGRLAAGSLGGTMEACFCQPIDTIKTRLQLDHAGKYKGI